MHGQLNPLTPQPLNPLVKTALVLGLGSSGEAAARLLLRQKVAVTVADTGSGEALETKARALREAGCTVSLGSREVPGGDFGLVVVSPGIPVENAWVATLKGRGIPLISELELGWRYCRSRVLAVTGSNGKSTLVKLCREALEQDGYTAVAGGNYGIPLSALVCEEPAPDWIVVEVSSFQLETVDQFAPDAGILLNLNPNHLDRHGSMEVYTNMKARLFARMRSGQVAVISETAPGMVQKAISRDARRVTFGVSEAASFRYRRGEITGPGLDHPVSVEGTLFDNEVMGVTAAACVAALVGSGLSPEGVTAAARLFERLPHRMQTVATIRDVTFVNDSKATNLAALSAGLGMASGPVRLIAGGLLKERDLNSVKNNLVKRVRGVYIIGKYSQVMASAWQDAVPCVICADLKEAVQRAWKDAKAGEWVLLSPGCASFDQFRSFEDRGEQFISIVRDIEKGEMIVKKARMMGSMVVVAGGLMLSAGCGTTKVDSPAVEPVVMPPMTETVAPVTKVEEVKPPVAEVQAKTYVVKSGDSIGLIAKRFKVPSKDILSLNKITNANKIRIGQKLTLPGYVDLNVPAPAKTAKAKKAVKVATSGDAYVVKSGDTLGHIAVAHKTTVKAIKQANSLTSDKVRIGQKLALPKGAAKVEKAPAVEGAAPVESAVPAVEGAGPVPAEGVAPAPKSNEVLHVVEPNQDLSSIAMMYGVRAEEVIKLNSLSSPDVKVGQTLKIPPPAE